MAITSDRISIGLTLSLSLALLTACNRDNAQAPATTETTEVLPAPGENNEVVSAVEDALGGAVGVITAEMTTTTNGFANAAAVSDMYEVQAAEIALRRSNSAEVKGFAEMMREAHTMTTNQLKLLAMAANVQLPAALDDRRQSMIENLSGASDEDFDVRYLNQQINAHGEALTLFRGYAEDGDNAAVKQFAAATAPKIEQHLNMAKMLDKSGADQSGGQR